MIRESTAGVAGNSPRKRVGTARCGVRTLCSPPHMRMVDREVRCRLAKAWPTARLPRFDPSTIRQDGWQSGNAARWKRAEPARVRRFDPSTVRHFIDLTHCNDIKDFLAVELHPCFDSYFTPNGSCDLPHKNNLGAIDAWCAQQNDQPGRAEGLRRLARLALNGSSTQSFIT